MNVWLQHGREPGVQPLLERMALPASARLEETVGADAVIRWGTLADAPAGVPVLNSLPAVLRALHPPARRDLLAIHGIAAESEPEPEVGSGRRKAARGAAAPAIRSDYVHEYRIPVFDLAALTVFAKEKTAHWTPSSPRRENRSAFGELDPAQRNFHSLRAIRQAVRAVYALGLDYAVVEIGITARGRTVVRDVEPVPRLDERLAELFAQAMLRFAVETAGEAQRTTPAVLGADPEFALRRPDGTIAAASRYLEREGRAGCDAIVLGGGRTAQPLAELRPPPSADPRVLTAQLRSAMAEAARRIDPALAWEAGGMPVRGMPLGGHIHFSGIALSSRFMRTLDNFLALPLALAETPEDRRRRPRYGALGDFRRKPHGGFEYRTPFSWLGSPELTLGTLCLARVLADHYRELDDNPLASRDVQRAFYNGERERLLPIVRSLWSELETTAGYRRYRSELDMLRELLLLRQAPLPAPADFRQAWKIGPFRSADRRTAPQIPSVPLLSQH